MSTLPPGYSLRNCREDDHPAIVEAIPVWWEGRDPAPHAAETVSGALQRHQPRAA